MLNKGRLYLPWACMSSCPCGGAAWGSPLPADASQAVRGHLCGHVQLRLCKVLCSPWSQCSGGLCWDWVAPEGWHGPPATEAWVAERGNEGQRVEELAISHTAPGQGLHPCPPTAPGALGCWAAETRSPQHWLACRDCQQPLQPWERAGWSTWCPQDVDNMPLHDTLQGLRAGC